MNIELAPISEKEMTYEEAILYCRFCTHNGYTDWRMPLYDEYRQYKDLYNIRFGWYVNRQTIYNEWDITPVRDI